MKEKRLLIALQGSGREKGGLRLGRFEMSTLHTLPSCFSRQWGLWWFIAVLLGSQCACQRGSGALK